MLPHMERGRATRTQAGATAGRTLPRLLAALLLLTTPLPGCDGEGRHRQAPEPDRDAAGKLADTGAESDADGGLTRPDAADATWDAGLEDGGGNDMAVVADGGGPDGSNLDGGGLDAAGPDPAWPSEACRAAAALPGWVEAGADGRTFTARSGGVTLQLGVLEDGILRLRYAPASGHSRPSWAVLPQPEAAPLELRATAAGDGLLLCTRLLAVEVTPGCRLRVTDARGQVLLEDGPDGGYLEGQEPLHGDTRSTVAVRRRVEPDEHFYGFGEKTGGLDKRGRTLIFWNRDSFDSVWHGFLPDADPLYVSIPFFIGLRGSTAYGLFTDNTYHLRMDMAASDPEAYQLTAFGGAIDQYLLAGPRMAEVLRRYTQLTGRLPLPPRWALGYHQSRWQDTELDRWVRDTCAELRRRRIPADGIWLDINHMERFRSFTWDPAVFPDPAGLVAELAGQGFATTVIVDPGIQAEPGWDVYADGLARGAFLRSPDGNPYIGEVWPGPSAFPDFSDPAVREWWAELVSRTVALGVQGVWIDMNEPTSFITTAAGNTLPDEVLAAGDGLPTTMAEIHNVYALLEAQATYDGMRRAGEGRRPFLLSRAGFAGLQRYAAVWTGDAPSDWAILEQTLAMVLGLGLSGIPFAGSDVGGYSGRATDEMFARWMQLGSISPFFRAHTESAGAHQEPWVFGPEVEEISRQAIGERYRLLPYLYSLMREAALTGAPPLRPLVWEFPEDEATHRLDGQALLGPWLLYAPILQRDVRALEAGEPNFRLYLPAGRWFELRSAAIWDGPGELALRATLGELPAFVRAGAILPSMDPVQWTGERPVDPLYLDLYPAAAGEETSFTLYEDDGRTLAHEQGHYSAVRYALRGLPDGAVLTAGPREGSFAPPARRLVLRLHRVERDPAAAGGEGPVALLDGAALPRAASYEALLGAPPGWWYDEDERTLVVACADHPELELRLRYDPAVEQLRPPVRVQLQVRVPPDTPRDRPVCVAASVDWDRHQPLAWSADDPDTAVGTIEVPRGEPFFYKYTRGSWETVEKWAGCAEATNRYAFGAAHPVRHDVVETWRDRCPGG